MSLPFYLQDPGPHWYDGRIPWHTLDLETTNLDKGDPRNPKNRIVMACLDGTVYDDMRPDDDGPPLVLVAHNAKFELGWMLRYGYDLSKFLPWDTMIAEYVLAGNRGWDLSLDATARRYGLPGKDPVIDKMMKAGICPSQMPERWLRKRVLYDVETALAVAKLQYKRLDYDGLLPVFFTRCATTPALASIEFYGMQLEADRVREEYEKERTNAADVGKQLDQITGGINLRSRLQLAGFLYDTMKFDELVDHNGEPLRTATGMRATDADSMAKLKAKTDEQRHFLKLLESQTRSQTRLSKALDVFNASVADHDGRLYANFNQCVTQTHRLSSSAKRLKDSTGKERGAQFQNMPREYKRLFRPSEAGRQITELDYAQLEFKIAVEEAGDKQGLADILSGHDVHRYTASVLRAKPMEAVTDAERTAAKPDTFKPLYYGQSGTPRQKAYYAAFRKRYPEIDQMQQRNIATVLREKKLTIASGLRFYWPDTAVDRSGYVKNSASICNYPIQSFATADIVLVGVTHLHWRLQDEDAFLINTVHDSAIVDHAPGVDVAGIGEQALIKDVRNYIQRVYKHTLTIPLTAEYLTAGHWADKSEKVATGVIKE